MLGKPETDEDFKSDYAYSLAKEMQAIHEFARERIEITDRRMQRNYDLGTSCKAFGVGDAVWLFSPNKKKGKSPKISKQWKGPYIITQKLNDLVYRVQETAHSKPKVVHYNRLTPYKGENKPIWFTDKPSRGS